MALFRSWSFGITPAVLGATLIWGVTVTTPFALPYWHGFIFNLGELPGALVIALGLLVYARRPHLAAFCWGLVAWHTKPVIFPVPLLLIFASAWSIAAPIRSKLWQFAKLLSMFLLPLIFWLLLISARFGVAAAAAHLTTFGGLIGLYTGHMQEAQPLYQLKSIGNPLSIARLISRLQDPHLEWSQSYYTLGTKLKTISLSLGSVAVTLLGLYQQRIQVALLHERVEFGFHVGSYGLQVISTGVTSTKLSIGQRHRVGKSLMRVEIPQLKYACQATNVVTKAMAPHLKKGRSMSENRSDICSSQKIQSPKPIYSAG